MSIANGDMSGRPEYQFELIRNDLPIRLQRKLGIIPDKGLGSARRALFLTLLAWLPIMVWAFVSGRLFEFDGAHGVLQNVSINVRSLIAIPALVLGESVALLVARRLVPEFVHGGLVRESERGRFAQILQDTARLRDSSLPWVLVLSLTAAWVLANPAELKADEIFLDARGGIAFGGMWLLYVVRPIFTVLLLGWIWRIVLLFILFSRIARLDLDLVPTHPDRAGGLGFLETLPAGFSLVTLALSALVTVVGYEALIHGHTLDSFKITFALFALFWSLVVLSPLVIFAPKLGRMKRHALLKYGALIGRHGRLVHKRWILGQPVAEADILEAPELGPVADTQAIFEAVKKTRSLPISKKSIVQIVVPLLIPVLLLAATQMPIKEVLLKLVKTLL